MEERSGSKSGGGGGSVVGTKEKNTLVNGVDPLGGAADDPEIFRDNNISPPETPKYPT